jgi:dUTP pyrophosphatase
MGNYPGKLIVFYGINNLGKSTQAKLLVERLKANGYQSEYLKYAIYSISPSGEILNSYLRDGNPYDLSPRESQIIQALNRTQYQDELIAKLKAGVNVVAEDYKGTGIAWGLGAGVDENFLKKINSHLIDEDLVFLFDGERFRQAIENNHKHENDDDLMNKVRWAHLKLREEYGWRKIDANRPIEEIHEEIWGQVHRRLEGKNDEDPKNYLKETYNYSGFQAIGDILTDGGKTIVTPNAVSSQLLASAPEQVSGFEKMTPINPPMPELPLNFENTEVTSVLRIEKTNPQAKLPTRAHAGDAGYDLYANDYYSITPYGQALVATGIKMAIPDGHVGLIWDKSGLAAEGIKTMGGVIDSGYRGEIKVVVKNLNELDFNIVPGQKIAQIIIQEYKDFPLEEEPIDGKTSRADGGFGSTGKF